MPLPFALDSPFYNLHMLPQISSSGSPVATLSVSSEILLRFHIKPDRSCATTPDNLLIRPQAKKKLQSLPRTDRFRIAEKLEQLGRKPDDSALLDIKKLEGEPYFRLRVAYWRVIYERHDVVRIITIEKIKPRGDAYK